MCVGQTRHMSLFSQGGLYEFEPGYNISELPVNPVDALSDVCMPDGHADDGKDQVV